MRPVRDPPYTSPVPPDPEPTTAATRAAPARRLLLLALGWTAFALGAIGLLLPIVPTTPFMLVALWAFSASSERFHRWLYTHRLFGPPLQKWQRDRAIPVWVKAIALGSMAVSLAWLAFVVRPPRYALLAAAALVACGAAFVLRIPSRPRQPVREP
ncbi:protein of unknown function DUF454 [Anaeromyxobacter dehalogenans 2CP-C]|uniref:DUF454 domain-containing protein n=1 Tax=Anaeromyxobacter dehalogenans (strain 2CP-C) TaxID=290397 RepID=Q2INC1_ANADE|nr:protein of unknown function DUF454 [Anaeromyxobacter dehalogenans 2CP-C]